MAPGGGPGVSDTDIRLGVLTDESGPRKAIGVLRLRAARVFFQALNDDGGIKGRRVHLVFGDHQSSREVAVEKYLDMRDSVLMFEQLFPVAFFKDELARDEILASPVARYSSLAGDRHLVMTGTSYRVEMSNAVDWLADTLNHPNGTRIGAVTQPDDYGADALAGIEDAARTHGFDLVAKLTFQPADHDYSSQVTALKEAGVEHIFMATTPRATAEIVEGCADIGFTPGFIGNTFAFDPQIIIGNPKLKPLFQNGWKTSRAFAHWGEDVPGMKTMLDAVRRYAPDQKPDAFFVQGWIQAGIVAEILERAAAVGDLTRPGMARALDTMADVEMGGLSGRLSYGRDVLGQPPSRQTRMFQMVVDDPRYPDMLKPITDF
ncbi:MAG TPA: ABC transporter substrate-binding protein [Actinomycetota bacterium]|nr:ABC transporter substrate-binding protein [Actinomycetota bacterium]